MLFKPFHVNCRVLSLVAHVLYISDWGNSDAMCDMASLMPPHPRTVQRLSSDCSIHQIKKLWSGRVWVESLLESSQPPAVWSQHGLWILYFQNRCAWVEWRLGGVTWQWMVQFDWFSESIPKDFFPLVIVNCLLLHRDLRSFYSFLGNIFLRNEFMFTFLFVLEVSQAALLV